MKKQITKRVSIVGEYATKPGSQITCSAIGTASYGVFCCGDDCKAVSVWTMDSKSPIKVLTGHSSEISSITFSKDESSIISGSQGGTIHVWDLQTQKIALALKEHRVACTAIGVPSAAGAENLLVSGSQDTNVKVWDLRTGKSLCSLKGHDEALTYVGFSPNNQWISSCDLGGCTKVH